MRYEALLRRWGHRRWFAAVGRRLVPLDRLVVRASKGRLSTIGRHGLPTLILTTRGRRSGIERSVPLLFARDADAIIVTASNWGQPHHPAWSANLLAEPHATVEVDGARVPVRAQLVDDAERARLWDLVTTVWPAYDTYAARAGRDIRLFRLERR
ncbi:MAG TPA: nitroreductase/quinone reductase family protein [Mycobacteriales bacterium]|nr:nitroreductase/quinone reductase family protein [Mycobacteriales bacterium]